MRAAEDLARTAGVDAAAVRTVVSPYRVCPIGAHVDHQGGSMLAIAIEARTLLVYAPCDDGRVRLTSENTPGVVAFDLAAGAFDGEGPEWGLYARGAARLLAEAAPAVRRGLVGRVMGTLPGGGLSSSASVLLAYLTALGDVNELALSERARVTLSRRVENEVVGVASGILDPAAIVGGRRGELLHIDSQQERWHSHALGAGAELPRVLVAFSGVERRLASSGFNDRVEECHVAAEALLAAAGLEPPRARRARLGDVSPAAFEAGSGHIPAPLARRARHYFSECARVEAGLADWQRGDLEAFGARMNASCESSLQQYETGSPELAALQQILVSTPGVLGARFSGGGFGGCSIALVEAAHADAAAARVHDAFARAFPALAARMRVFVADSDDGVRVEPAARSAQGGRTCS